MPQFDVHRNTGRHRDTIPYVVVVQSSLYDGYRRRVVAPLVRKALLGTPADTRFNPTFMALISVTRRIYFPLVPNLLVGNLALEAAASCISAGLPA